MLKRNSLRKFQWKKSKFHEFSENLYKHQFWLVWLVSWKWLHLAATINLSGYALKKVLCKISAKSDRYYRSYAVFLIFGVVGWLGWLDTSKMHKKHIAWFSHSSIDPCKKSLISLKGFLRYRHLKIFSYSCFTGSAGARQ